MPLLEHRERQRERERERDKERERDGEQIQSSMEAFRRDVRRAQG
jgi:hypothetical protein